MLKAKVPDGTDTSWRMKQTKERVGIVGVGRMGLAMLKHLVKHGHAVTACDIDDKQLAKAREAGAATAEDARRGRARRRAS